MGIGMYRRMDSSSSCGKLIPKTLWSCPPFTRECGHKFHSTSEMSGCSSLRLLVMNNFELYITHQGINNFCKRFYTVELQSTVINQGTKAGDTARRWSLEEKNIYMRALSGTLNTVDLQSIVINQKTEAGNSARSESSKKTKWNHYP